MLEDLDNLRKEITDDWDAGKLLKKQAIELLKTIREKDEEIRTEMLAARNLAVDEVDEFDKSPKVLGYEKRIKDLSLIYNYDQDKKKP